MDSSPPIDDRLSGDRRRKAYALAKELDLTREERMTLAEYVLRCDITSWGQLSDSQMCRLLDAMEGYAYVSSLLMQRA